MPGLFTILKNASIFHHNHRVLRPYWIRQDTKNTIHVGECGGFVGIFSLKHRRPEL
jgi:hypothetical protein